MRKRCSIQQGEKDNCWLEQSPKNRLFRCFLFEFFFLQIYKWIFCINMFETINGVTTREPCWEYLHYKYNMRASELLLFLVQWNSVLQQYTIIIIIFLLQVKICLQYKLLANQLLCWFIVHTDVQINAHKLPILLPKSVKGFFLGGGGGGGGRSCPSPQATCTLVNCDDPCLTSGHMSQNITVTNVTKYVSICPKQIFLNHCINNTNSLPFNEEKKITKSTFELDIGEVPSNPWLGKVEHFSFLLFLLKEIIIT